MYFVAIFALFSLLEPTSAQAAQAVCGQESFEQGEDRILHRKQCTVIRVSDERAYNTHRLTGATPLVDCSANEKLVTGGCSVVVDGVSNPIYNSNTLVFSTGPTVSGWGCGFANVEVGTTVRIEALCEKD